MRYRLEYLLFTCFAAPIRLLPRTLALAAGRGLGRLALRLQNKRTRIADDNLRQALPELSEAQRAEIIREVFANFGESFIDMLRLDKFGDRAEFERLFSIEGMEHFEAVQAQGKGCIVMTGHVGFWEAGNFFMPLLGYPFSVVAKPMKNPMVDDYFRRMRQSFGTEIIDSRKGARKIVKALQDKRMVGVLIDQHIAVKEAVSVPFFGRPAWTTPIIAQIAMKYQVPVLPVFVYRAAHGRYRLCIDPPVTLEPSSDKAAIVANTALLTGIIEQAIRRDLGQWFWIHRRWKYTPTDEHAS